MSANNFSLKSSPRVVWFKRGVVLAVLLGFTWLIVSAITSNVDDENLEPSLVKAPDLVKQRPETPGGMKIDHQDKQLFDLLESETSTNDVNDSVVAKAKDLANKNEALSAAAIEKKELEAKLEQAKQAEKEALIKKEQELRAKAELAAKQKELAKKAEQQALSANQKKEVVKTVEKAMATVPAAPTPAAPVAATSYVKGWVVQLGSFRKTADAERAVTVYNKKVGNILKDLKPYIKKADLGSKGIVYRVYFTGLKDKEHAQQICDQLKAQGQACFRVNLK